MWHVNMFWLKIKINLRTWRCAWSFQAKQVRCDRSSIAINHFTYIFLSINFLHIFESVQLIIHVFTTYKCQVIIIFL